MINIRKVLLIGLQMIFLVTFSFASISLKIPLQFYGSLIIFFISIFYALNDIVNRSALFIFLLSFFVFLVGRDFVYFYFDFGENLYQENINNYTYITFMVTLLSILIFYFLFETFSTKSNYKNVEDHHKTLNKDVLQKVSLMVFYPILFFSTINKAYLAYFSNRIGYLNIYSEYNVSFVESPILALLNLIEVALPVPLAVFLATRPEKNKVMNIFKIYTVYLIISLFTGSRATFMLGIFVMFYYILSRADYKKFINYKFTGSVIFGGPLLIVIAMYIDSFRNGEKFQFSNISNLFLSFFNQQGVSISTIKIGKMVEDYFPEGKIYTLKFLYSGLPARILNLPIYRGNNAENALLGNDFNHALSYFALGEAYFKGAGAGSSYIAETMHDGGFIYLIIMSIIYAYLLYIASTRRNRKLNIQVLILLTLPSLFWAPRGNAMAFIEQLIAPSSLITYLIIYLLYQFYVKRIGYKNFSSKKTLF
ncbi:O-antigen polysaccharide polymerase Wzy family protein [Aerococcus viridans]|uniref:O-antigen polysaccharide polymerase Wzy family protein n=1 Tax=Aerococcus viridans TaxID=1377 RepID=UPI0039B01ED3